jgi:hypothetical protein
MLWALSLLANFFIRLLFQLGAVLPQVIIEAAILRGHSSM